MRHHGAYSPPLLFVVMAMVTTALQMVFPVLTLLFFDQKSLLFAQDTPLATRSLWYGAAIAITQALTLVAAPLLSSASDYIGRQKVFMLAITGITIVMLLMGIGAQYGLLGLVLLGCALQGMCAHLKPLAQAMIGAHISYEKKIIHMGRLQLAIALGAFIGPVLGGYMSSNSFIFFHFSLPYVVAALLGVASLFLTRYVFTKNCIAANPVSLKQLIKSLCALGKQRRIIVISLLLFLCQFSWSMYYPFMPPLLKNATHYSSQMIGIFMSMIAFWLSIASLLGIRIAARYWSIQSILHYALILLLSGIILSLTAVVYPTTLNALLWLSAAPIAIGDVIAYSCMITLYSHAVLPSEQGAVMGLCFIVVSLTWTITGLCGGWLVAMNPINSLLVAPIGASIFLLVYPRVRGSILNHAAV